MAEEQPREAQETASFPEDVEGLKQALVQERARSEDYLGGWRRSQADFQNFKRRADEEHREAAQYANGLLVANLLPVLDDLERALDNASGRLAGLTWVDGIRLVYRKLQAVLEAHGLKEIMAVGEDFDPRYHEAALEGEGEEGKILTELQKGYLFGSRVIRPAMVKVGRRPATAEARGNPAEGQKE